MRRALLLLLVPFLATACLVEAGGGVVGITVDRDFKVVSFDGPDSPASRAGVRVGDHLIAVNTYPTAKMQNLEEFAKRAMAAAGSEIQLEFIHSGSGQSFHIRIRRMPARTPTPSQVPPGFDARQASRPLHFEVTSTVSLRAMHAPVRLRSSCFFLLDE
jgi:predicted metalloprotease with PDZ domain